MGKTIITAALTAADPALDELGEPPVWGSDGAVRCMTRSLRRRYSAVLRGGQGSAEPLGIGAKAMEAV